MRLFIVDLFAKFNYDILDKKQFQLPRHFSSIHSSLLSLEETPQKQDLEGLFQKCLKHKTDVPYNKAKKK